MFDFRLKVFDTVARRLNFTKAAEELFITQPAVTKHIHELESHFKTKLFERNGSKIKLSAAGETLLQHTSQLFAVYRNLEFEMNALIQQQSGLLRIGASTTVAQYVLPPVLASFHKKFKNVRISCTTGNTEYIEQRVQHNETDLGIIEGRSRKTVLQYTPFIKDEIVLVASMHNPLARKSEISIQELKKVPLLLREPGSGTLEVIAHALKPLGVKLADCTVEMQLDSTESMKNYLLHSGSMAFVSVHSVLKELRNKECCIIDVKGLAIERYFYFIQPMGQPESLADLFMKFAAGYNFR